jgi:hypothetical protein
MPGAGCRAPNTFASTAILRSASVIRRSKTSSRGLPLTPFTYITTGFLGYLFVTWTNVDKSLELGVYE